MKLDDEDSGFYHLNVYFLASNREQARQFYAGLDRFLQQFDDVVLQTTLQIPEVVCPQL